MPTPSTHEITQLLLAWGDGDQSALEKLMPIVYDELRRLAHHHMARERAGHSLQTTALVNEVYLRLIDAADVNWQNRAHFFAICSRLMRRVLVDLARSRHYQKRGADARRVSLDETMIVSGERSADLVALDDALNALAEIDPQKGHIVEMRFFGGLNTDEIAEVLKVSSRTIEREWRKAKAWLHRALTEEQTNEA